LRRARTALVEAGEVKLAMCDELVPGTLHKPEDCGFVSLRGVYAGPI
jgi:hypothetical protein